MLFRSGMMALIALALVVSLGYSLVVTVSSAFNLGFAGMDFWWELATLITIMLVGHWIEMSAVMGASNALGELKSMLPDTAVLISGKKQETVPVGKIQVGDQIMVSPGAIIPVDGEVVSGTAKLNESMLTGESALIDKAEGSVVFAGTVNSADADLKLG